MDYFDCTAGKARLALIKYQATVSKKKGTLFANPGATITYDGLDGVAYAEAFQVDPEGLASTFCPPWDPSSARTSKGSTISSLGTLAVLVPTRCEFHFRNQTKHPIQLIPCP